MPVLGGMFGCPNRPHRRAALCHSTPNLGPTFWKKEKLKIKIIIYNL
jgi:hypothetical protein